MKRSVKANLTIILAATAGTACDQTGTSTPAQLPPGATAVVLNLTATKTYSPLEHDDGTQVVKTDTVITLPLSIGVTAGHADSGNRVAFSFDGGTVDNVIGIRCYYISNAAVTSYEFSSCDGGAGGGGVWPYFNAGDAVKLPSGDTLVLRVMEGDASTPTTVTTAIAGIQSN
jgi:hypothetical protein